MQVFWDDLLEHFSPFNGNFWRLSGFGVLKLIYSACRRTLKIIIVKIENRHQIVIPK